MERIFVEPTRPFKPDSYKYLAVTKFKFDFSSFGNSLVCLFFGFFASWYLFSGLEIENFIHGIVLIIGVGLGIAGFYFFFMSFQFYETTKRIPKTELEILEDKKEYDNRLLDYQASLSEYNRKTKEYKKKHKIVDKPGFFELAGAARKKEASNGKQPKGKKLNDENKTTAKAKLSGSKRLTTTPYINSDLVHVKIIESIPEPKSLAPKRIGYLPNDIFTQKESYKFAVVKMPQKNSLIKFPRKGRSDRKGVTEDPFFVYLNRYFKKEFKLFNNRHIPTENGRPYEPDFVLLTEKKKKNIFIDIEIDEPYDGLKRTATNCVGENDLRDEFFTKRGWIVIRFAEIQIHLEPEKCCSLIAAVINSIDSTFNHELLGGDFPNDIVQWDKLLAEKWASENYREQYLGIDKFAPQANVLVEYEITESEVDTAVENGIPKYQNSAPIDEGRLALANANSRDKRIQFDSIGHRYFIDGNSDTISVTQLIDKFFPEFDGPYWSKKKARERLILERRERSEENIRAMQNLILEEWNEIKVKAAELGKALHFAIENYYNGNGLENETVEFQHFLSFKEKYPSMSPYRSEWRIFDEDLLVAGTIDMLYKKPDGSLYMFDWKRSENVVLDDGSIRDDDFQYAFGELGHLGNNSFNKYCLQMNIYRSILEKRYNKKISSMNLLVLHEIYETYHHIKIPNMDNEVKYIFSSRL